MYQNATHEVIKSSQKIFPPPVNGQFIFVVIIITVYVLLGFQFPLLLDVFCIAILSISSAVYREELNVNTIHRRNLSLSSLCPVRLMCRKKVEIKIVYCSLSVWSIVLFYTLDPLDHCRIDIIFFLKCSSKILDYFKVSLKINQKLDKN